MSAIIKETPYSSPPPQSCNCSTEHTFLYARIVTVVAAALLILLSFFVMLETAQVIEWGFGQLPYEITGSCMAVSAFTIFTMCMLGPWSSYVPPEVKPAGKEVAGIINQGLAKVYGDLKAKTAFHFVKAKEGGSFCDEEGPFTPGTTALQSTLLLESAKTYHVEALVITQGEDLRYAFGALVRDSQGPSVDYVSPPFADVNTLKTALKTFFTEKGLTCFRDSSTFEASLAKHLK